MLGTLAYNFNATSEPIGNSVDKWRTELDTLPCQLKVNERAEIFI